MIIIFRITRKLLTPFRQILHFLKSYSITSLKDHFSFSIQLMEHRYYISCSVQALREKYLKRKQNTVLKPFGKKYAQNTRVKSHLYYYTKPLNVGTQSNVTFFFDTESTIDPQFGRKPVGSITDSGVPSFIVRKQNVYNK